MVVDISSIKYQITANMPLIVLEVNADAMTDASMGKGAIVANPKCSVIICLMAAPPLHRWAKVVRVVVITFKQQMILVQLQWRILNCKPVRFLKAKQPRCKIFSQQYAFSLFSHNAPLQSNGYKGEEMKLVKETRKIWNEGNDVRVTITLLNGSCDESVNLQFENPLDEDTRYQIKMV